MANVFRVHREPTSTLLANAKSMIPFVKNSTPEPKDVSSVTMDLFWTI